MGVCIAMSLLYAARVLYWIIIVGSSIEVEQKVPSCVGEECFQVFSCKGLKDATAHVMEPLFTVSGLIFFPMGFHAAHHGDDLQMKRFALFLLGMTVLRIAVIGCDMLFLHNCQMYDSNMMSSVLSTLLPPSPLRVGVQEKLRSLSTFPVQVVDAMTSGFNLSAWYLVLTGLWAAFFLYVTIEAIALSSLMQYGLLGLGVHYGLDQWDEELNRTAIRRKVQSGIRSKFMDDAQLPLSQGSHVGQLSAYGTVHGYGPAYSSYRKESAADYSMPSTRYEVEMEEEEDEAEVVRQLAEKLSQEESPEAILDRAFFE